MPVTVDQTILNNKYQIIRLIGEGGMARVWLAQELTFGNRLVAIKEPRRNLLVDDIDKVKMRYRREVELCAALQKAGVPNIVQAHTAEPYEDGHLLVMTYMPGGDLASLIKEDPNGLPVARVIQIALDVLSALAATHDQPWGVVHRDIKPSNILFDNDGRAYLADFGIAQMAGQTDGRTHFAGALHPGTLEYMAPEQESSFGYLTPSADLFALGCVIFEMLTGQRYKKQRPGTHARDMRRGVPKKLNAVLTKALAAEPSERWQSANEMISAISSGTPMRHVWMGAAMLFVTLVVGALLWRDSGRDAVPLPGPEFPTPISATTLPSPTFAAGSPLPGTAPAPVLPTEVLTATLTIAPAVLAATELVTSAEMRLGRGHISDVDYAPNGTMVAVATSLGVWLYNPDQFSDGRLLPHSSWVSNVAWSPDGKKLVTGSDDYLVQLWDVFSGEVISRLEGHTDSVNSVAWSPNGDYVASGADDNTVRVWDVASGEQVYVLREHKDDVSSVAWSPDSTQLASGAKEDFIILWNTVSGTRKKVLGDPEDLQWVLSLSWSPDGRQLVSSALDESIIRIWDTETGDLLRTLTGHSGGVFSIAWSPDGSQIASGSMDNDVRIWDSDSGDTLQRLGGHAYLVTSVAWSPFDSHVISGAVDGELQLWDVASATLLTAIPDHLWWLWDVAWSNDGNWLAAASRDRTGRVWDAASGRLLLTLKGHTSDVTSIAWSPDDSRLATGSYDETVRVWDSNTGRLLSTLQGHTWMVYCVAWSPQGLLLASGAGDGTARIWDPSTGDTIAILGSHDAEVNSVVWSPDGGVLATASGDNVVRLWDAGTWTLVHELEGHTNDVNSLAWSPDGAEIASGGDDRFVRIWDTSNGELLQTLMAGDEAVNSVAWSFDGRYLAFGTDSQAVQLWDTATWANLSAATFHNSEVTGLGWSRNGNELASSSTDGTVQRWVLGPTTASSGTYESIPASPIISSTIAPTPTATSTPSLLIGTTINSSIDGMVMVYVPAGDFVMGNSSDDGEQSPQHVVRLDDYWIDRTEVTNAMYRRFVEATGYVTDAERSGISLAWQGNGWNVVADANWRQPIGPSSNLNGLDTHPVVQVSWNDAVAYCEWVERRLPTEAEWEKAARGTDARTYPWGDTNLTGDKLNSADVNLDSGWANPENDDGYRFTSPVGSFPNGASPYGALDIAGNVQEWVSDWFSETYYSESPVLNPIGPATGDAKVRRGGTWASVPVELEVVARSASRPAQSDDTSGFRCALSAD